MYSGVNLSRMLRYPKYNNQLLPVFFAPKVLYEYNIVHRRKVTLLHSRIQNIVCGSIITVIQKTGV